MGKRLTIDSFMVPFPGSILREQDELVRAQLQERFEMHEDLGIIMETFEDCGVGPTLRMINMIYDPDFVL